MAEIEGQVFPVEDVNAGEEVKVADSVSAEEVELRTYVTNLAPKLVLTLDTHFWAGRSVIRIPRIATGTYGVAIQRGTLPAGVKFGICYADGEDSTARKWVVAFDTTAQKAYAEAGPTGPVDWNVIEVKLGLAGNKSEYEDKILGGKCLAEINGLKANGTFR